MALNWTASDERNQAILAGKLDDEIRRSYFFSQSAFTMSADDAHFRGNQSKAISLPMGKLIVKIQSPFKATPAQLKGGGNKYVIRTLNRIKGDTPGQAGGVVWNQDRALGKEGVDSYREHEIIIGMLRKAHTEQTDEFTNLLQGNWAKLTKESLPGRMIDFHNRYESVHFFLMALIWGHAAHVTGATSLGGLNEGLRLHMNCILAGQANPTWSATAATWQQTVARAAMTMRDQGVAGNAACKFGKAFMDRMVYEADDLGVPMVETSVGLRRICLIHKDQEYDAAQDPELQAILKGWGTNKADQSDFYVKRAWLDYGETLWIRDWWGGMEATPYLNTDSGAGLNDTSVTAANATSIAFGPLTTSTEADPYDGTKYRPVRKDWTDFEGVRSTKGAVGYATGIRACMMLGENALIGIENDPVQFARETDDYGQIVGVCTREIGGVSRNDDWQPSTATKTTCRNSSSLIGFSQTAALGEVLVTA